MKQERHDSIEADGETLALGQLIKSGGAGSVYLLPRRGDSVAKLYHPTIDRAVYERKVEAMLALVPDLPDRIEHGRRYVQIAWPTAQARDGRRRFLGFLMPLLDIAATEELEPVLQERQALAKGLPTALGPKITLAANLASVLSALHRQQHYVVDLKPVNLRFYRDSLYIALLDCDGFSIHGPGGQRFHAQQYTPDYLAPEFQANGLDARGELAQDLFALAVVIFQLLNFGIHPYTGQPRSERVPTDIPGRIGAGCYAYGRRAHPDMAPSPASCHALLPDELRALFDRAFQSRARPSAAEWAEQLGRYARPSSGLLTACRRDPKHQHFAELDCPTCIRSNMLERARRQPRPARPKRANAVQATTGSPARHAPVGRTSPNPTSPALALVYLVLPMLVLWFVLGRSCSPTAHAPPPQVTTSAPAASTAPPSADPAPEAAIRRVAPPDAQVVETDLLAVLDALSRGDASAARAGLEAMRARAAKGPKPQAASLGAYYAELRRQPSPGGGIRAFEQSTRPLRDIIDADPYANFAVTELAMRELLGGARDAARTHYAQAAWTAPDQGNGWYGLGISYAGQNDERAAAAMAIGEWLAGEHDASMLGTQLAFLTMPLHLSPEQLGKLRERTRTLVDALGPAP